MLQILQIQYFEIDCNTTKTTKNTNEIVIKL